MTEKIHYVVACRDKETDSLQAWWTTDTVNEEIVKRTGAYRKARKFCKENQNCYIDIEESDKE